MPVNLELVKDLWLPNIFIYNLKTFKVVEVLSKHAGLWVSPENAILYSQATHITFICPMRFDSFPLDTQVRAGVGGLVFRQLVGKVLKNVCFELGFTAATMLMLPKQAEGTVQTSRKHNKTFPIR